MRSSLLVAISFFYFITPLPARDLIQKDICVYGGNAAGVIAAVTAVNEGRSVILVEPSRHVGGLTTGGLGATDIGNKSAIGGMSRDFYKRLGTHYKQDEAWHFEPHVAEDVLKDLITEHKVTVLFEHRIKSLEKDGRRVVRIILEHAPPDPDGAPAANAIDGDETCVEALMYIDTSYEGDVMARAKVTYTIGRESVKQYGESLNGIRASTPHHQFKGGVDPFVKKGDPSSGLLPLIQTGDGGVPGDADRRVQAYNFRLCLTRTEENRLPIGAPPGYDPARFEILARHIESNPNITLSQLLSIIKMPGGKTDINNNGAVSTDFIGGNYDYPDGDYATRSRIWKEHLAYTQCLLHFLATSDRVPESVRKDMNSWGLCKDEFADTGGWPRQLYIREARRMIGPYVVTQADCDHKTKVDDSIGMASYNMDSHNCERIVQKDEVRNEGDVQVGPKGPYSVSYRAITPKADECENLLVPVCLSATHIAYGSIRMEPVFMIISQCAAIAASRAIEEKKPVQAIDVAGLQKRLRDAKQILELK